MTLWHRAAQLQRGARRRRRGTQIHIETLVEDAPPPFNETTVHTGDTPQPHGCSDLIKYARVKPFVMTLRQAYMNRLYPERITHTHMSLSILSVGGVT